MKNNIITKNTKTFNYHFSKQEKNDNKLNKTKASKGNSSPYKNSNNSSTKNSSSKKNNSDKKQKNEKPKRHLPTSLIIIISVLFLVIFLTWVVPHEAYEGVPDGNYPIPIPENGKFGIFDSAIAISAGFVEVAGLILYLFVLGAFIEILIQTGTMSTGFSSLLRRNKDKEIYVIPLLFILFSFFGSAWGMQEETIAYYAVLVPFLYMAGFNSKTAIVTMMLGVTTGIAASTLNPFTIAISVESLNTEYFPEGSLSIGTLMGARFVIWFLLTAVGATFVTIYAKKEREKNLVNPKFNDEREKKLKLYNVENVESTTEDEIERLSKRQIISLYAFFITFLVMILGMFPWADFFPNANWDGYVAWRNQHLFFISTVMSPIGQWGFAEMSLIFMIGIVAQMIIHGIGQYRFTNMVYDGIKGMAPVAALLGFARAISVILIYSGLNNTIVNGLAGVAQGAGPYLFLFLMFIVFLIIGIIIPSTTAAATITMPIISGVVALTFTEAAGYSADYTVHMMASVIIMYSMGLGIANMFTPTQAVVLASVEAAHLEYSEYLKPGLTFALMISLINIVIIIPLLLMIAPA